MGMRYLALMTVLLVGCVGSAPVTPADAGGDDAAGQAGAISRAELGDDWPLTIDSGVLACEPVNEVVIVGPDGRTYGLNGAARGSERWADGVEILRDGMTPADLGELIERGLALCE